MTATCQNRCVGYPTAARRPRSGKRALAPIYHAVWPMVRPSFPREFGEMFDREICSVPLREPVDLAKQMKANLAVL